MEAKENPNPLISTSRTSDTSPTVQLHPLVLLNISDYITRHQARGLNSPIVGGIFGQQHGQDITMEVAFEAKAHQNDAGEIFLDDDWFSHRVDDYKAVYKQPPLELVGWFAIGPPSGPVPLQLPVHMRLSELYTESPILLLFHASQVFTDATAAGKLPITLYEPVVENARGETSDKAMDVDEGSNAKVVTFREVAYTVETGEAEMIAVDFVARGGGNATAIESSVPADEKKQPAAESSKKGKGKAKAAAKPELTEEEPTVLTGEDEELMSILTAKANAIKMLQRRIDLIRSYLDALPPSYLNEPSLPINPTPTAEHPLPINHTILRSINALVARMDILTPADLEQFALETQQETTDVQLVSLLSSLTNSIAAVKQLGHKHHIIELQRNQNKHKGLMGMPQMQGKDPSTEGFLGANEQFHQRSRST